MFQSTLTYPVLMIPSVARGAGRLTYVITGLVTASQSPEHKPNRHPRSLQPRTNKPRSLTTLLPLGWLCSL